MTTPAHAMLWEIIYCFIPFVPFPFRRFMYNYCTILTILLGAGDKEDLIWDLGAKKEFSGQMFLFIQSTASLYLCEISFVSSSR